VGYKPKGYYGGEHSHGCNLDMKDSGSRISDCDGYILRLPEVYCRETESWVPLSVQRSGCRLDQWEKQVVRDSASLYICLHVLTLSIHMCVLQTVDIIPTVMWLCVTLNCATDSG
jgi:hypothetical protein